MKTAEELIFGAKKYAAFNLMLARWLSVTKASVSGIVYVTMGGTELYDVANICWIDEDLVQAIISYEQNPDRFRLASRSVKVLEKYGLNVTARQANYFSYERDSDAPHAFFIDLTGPFHKNYIESLRRWIISSVLRPGDLIMITSYQGRNIGYEKLLKSFDEEFNLLGVSEFATKKDLYRAAHPAFVMYSAIEQAGFNDELRLVNLGTVRYSDTSPMGLYGYLLEDGTSNLDDLVSNLRVFDTVRRTWHTVAAA